MFIFQFSVNLFLFLIGIFGIFLNRRNILIILMCIELVLLAVNLNFVVFSIYLDDITGQIFSFFVLTVAAAESSIGLAIIITYYRIRGSIQILQNISIKG